MLLFTLCLTFIALASATPLININKRATDTTTLPNIIDKASAISALDTYMPTHKVARANIDPTYCGSCVNTDGHVRFLNTGRCNTLSDGEKYVACSNQWCGICIIWKGQQCFGDMLHQGGAMEGAQDVKDGQSYFCM